jgi:hypothetical protein
VRVALAVVMAAAATILPKEGAVSAQGQPPRTPRAAAPIDLEGTWVSVVTEEWRWRMVTPPKGDVGSIPVNDAARKIAGAWDPTADERTGNACKAYGAPAIMRVPGRLKIAWQDDTTLRIETDAGQQVRLLRFGDARPPAGDPTWQGYSRAEWEYATRADRSAGPSPGAGSLKVVTTRLRPGYLMKNGVPYSANAVLTEHFHRHDSPNGDVWFTVVTMLEDPTYLTERFVNSTHFKREPDDSKWRPTPCTVG